MMPWKKLAEASVNALLTKPVSYSSLFDTLCRIFGKTSAKTIVRSLKSREEDMLRPIRGAHLLLVEDNEINQQVACEILEEAGLKVDVAENGQIGLERVRKFPYDLVLMDLQMPVMDGYQATREIRKDERFQELPIVAMTASAMTQDREDTQGRRYERSCQ